MKLTVKILFALSILLNFNYSLAQQLVKAKAVPGGVAEINLPSNGPQKPHVFFKNHRVLVTLHADSESKHWQALVGIPISLQPGMYNLSIEETGKPEQVVSFVVSPKKYPTQFITFTRKHKQNLITPKDFLKIRVIQQRHKIEALLNTWSEQSTPNKFIEPIHGRVSSAFGLRRFYNKVPKSPHTGLDLAAAKGTPIKAAADGTVIEAGKLVLTGNTVFIDHGQGLITLYAHMSSTNVKTGQHVKQGQVIGKVGMTGRANGPHLHWGVVMNQARVDPSLFIRTVS